MAQGNVTVRTDNIPLAVGTIVFTVLALSLGDALIKLTSSNFVIWQIFVLRSAMAIPVLLVVMRVQLSTGWHWPVDLGWTVLRSGLLVCMWISYYLALPHLQLSVAAAAYYTLPIFITLFSACLVGDRISRFGWLAVFLGFFGVLLILKPSSGDFNWYALFPLASAMLYAVAMILTRTKCGNEHPLILSLALNVAFVVVGGGATLLINLFASAEGGSFLLAPWVVMGIAEWGTMVLLAAAILIGSIGAAVAYQNGPSSMVGTFDFAYVGFAVLWGILFFSDVPDLTSILGMGLIVCAGVLSIRQ
ncbi:DMT family transporter [Kiloniella sp.]|uniref:DMT family transporter n=1 Tax=Kiloniella sp. TaxID=1938587 RepID=UPI003B016F68